MSEQERNVINARIERLENALRFYADHKQWKSLRGILQKEKKKLKAALEGKSHE